MAHGAREVSMPLRLRGALRGPRAAVAANHPLAAQAGLKILFDGGTAADMAVAMAAVMVVVQPYHSNLGGERMLDCFDLQPISRKVRKKG